MNRLQEALNIRKQFNAVDTILAILDLDEYNSIHPIEKYKTFLYSASVAQGKQVYTIIHCDGYYFIPLDLNQRKWALTKGECVLEENVNPRMIDDDEFPDVLSYLEDQWIRRENKKIIV